MVLVCPIISQYDVIKVSCDFMWVGAHQVSYHPAKFGGHRHSVSGDISLVCHAIS